MFLFVCMNYLTDGSTSQLKRKYKRFWKVFSDFSNLENSPRTFKINTPGGVWKSRSALVVFKWNNGINGVGDVCEGCWIRRYNVHGLPGLDETQLCLENDGMLV